MKEKIFIILGNGFSINLINKLKLNDYVNLINLFKLGDEVKYPDYEGSCFLSRKNCENLWALGARTTMSNEEATRFIDDIITCLNVFSMSKKYSDELGQTFYSEESMYIKAYNELTTYLRNLFLYYNNIVKDEFLNEQKDSLNLIRFLKKCDIENKEVIIVSYNYDIFLERILMLEKVDFSVQGFDQKESNLKIIKPHGSISFVSKADWDPSSRFNIKDIIASNSEPLEKLKVSYDLTHDKSLINALIPPAGDANRSSGWPRNVRDILIEELRKSTDKDKIIIYGVSYNHVDRNEIDDILTKINQNSQAIYINPYPSKTFDLVLSSIFRNYEHYKNEQILGELK